ncbi:tripartite motif-containing protein 3-like [Ylistrum balloti]|uniref:tripartite motif-containing protein 3-like n=1 Tax=Ylistrum balloti TaxID=509963 RepID=UPI002905A299|nr:tripartite motif-containing protein 3-like [Ylistrum balloti]
MAQRVIQNVENDYLMCSICLGRYDDPRLLPCGHTFCKECLSGHIQQTVIDRNSRHFTCPIDRNMVSRPANRAPKDWAGLFPPDTFLSSLLTTVLQHEGGQGNNRSVSIQKSDRPIGNDRPFRSNNSNDRPYHSDDSNDHFPVSHAGPSFGQSHMSEGLTCVEHPGRVLEFFCLGCNALVCSYCAVRGHRGQRCECITMEDAIERLRPRMEALRRRLRGQMSRVEQLSRGETPADGMLDASRTRAMEKLDEIENNLSRFAQTCLESVEELRQQTRDAGRGLMTENAQMSRLFDSIQETKLTFENVVSANSGPDLLNWLSRMEKQADDYDAAISSSSQTNTPSEAEFVAHTVFSNFLRNPPPVGSVRVKHDAGRNTQRSHGCRLQ